MKKIMILTVAITLAASSAFAGSSISIADGFPNAGKVIRGDATTASATTALIGKLSTGVEAGILCDVTNGAGYSMVTQHKSGTKAFGSAYDSTAIWSYIGETTPGTVILAVPTATDTSDFTASFKPM